MEKELWIIKGKVIECWDTLKFSGKKIYKTVKGHLYSEKEYNDLYNFLNPNVEAWKE